jgi:hypothetical protein
MPFARSVVKEDLDVEIGTFFIDLAEAPSQDAFLAEARDTEVNHRAFFIN